MQLNIKDAETVGLARELAEATELAITQVIKVAIERELNTLRQERENRLDRMRAKVSKARMRWKPEFDGEELSITYKDHLYGEGGLPK